MRRTRVALVALLTGGFFIFSAGTAWAPHVAQLLVEPRVVNPGDTVTVTGTRGFGAEQPVDVRLDDIDGPVLGTFQTDDQFFAAFGPVQVTIPADISPGAHTLVATQVLDAEDAHIRGVPARAAIEVVGPGGLPAENPPLVEPVEPRPDQLAVGDEVGLGALALVALGVAGVAMFAAAMVALVTARRSSAPEATTTRS